MDGKFADRVVHNPPIRGSAVGLTMLCLIECEHDHRAGDLTPDESADHHHVHSVSIDIFTELFDVVRWLPTIAAESYLPKEPWDQINQLAGKFNQLIKPVKNKTMLTDRRAAYQDVSSQTEAMLVGLEEMFVVYEKFRTPF